MAEFLPFLDLSFDATMGVLTFHHWTDQLQGLVEVIRVIRKRIIMSHLILC
jgi:ubiquinone/menaquinone biosynthesis C-methylase UbiE